ncbi:MAG: hypothetical protein AB7G25_07680 [Sphingomonadaceae bacterium]
MQEIDRFKAQADDGSIYEIVEYGSRIDTSHLTGKGSIKSLSELRTTSGSPVNDLGDGSFKIVRTGEIVRKID